MTNKTPRVAKNTQQNSVQWYHCLKLKYSLDENGNGGTEEHRLLAVNWNRPIEDGDIKESRDEEERVVARIETCLLAANLSRYLEKPVCCS